MDNSFKSSPWQTILACAVLVTGLSFVVTVVQTPKYKSQVRILVVPQWEKIVDPYTAAKSTEYISNILTKVVYSNSFFNQVVDSGFYIVKSQFSDNPIRRSLQWKRMIQAEMIGNTGIIEIEILHKDKYQAEQFASAVAQVLVTKGDLYHGAENVVIKVIDPPISSKRPEAPDMPLNLFVGSVLGVMAGIGFVYLFPQYSFQWALPRRKKAEAKVKAPPISIVKEKAAEPVVKIAPKIPEPKPVAPKESEKKEVKPSLVVKQAPPPVNLPTIKEHMNIK